MSKELQTKVANSFAGQETNLLLGNWEISLPILYLVLAVSGSVAVRLVTSVLKAIDKGDGQPRETIYPPFRSRLWCAFKGAKQNVPSNNDYLHPLFLGIIEFCAYPVLMVTTNWSFIGAWLAFKTLGQWKAWTDRRCPFNRFLIGNALVLILSLLILTRLVSIVKA